MRILLDTHILLWALAEPHRLDEETRAAIAEGADAVLFSAASIWEIAIKSQLQRSDFAVRPSAIAREARNVGFIELAVHSEAVARVADLPMLHRDPFDRLLIAQAMIEPALLYTADGQLSAYTELVRRVG
jgi:PIN domain nuclease of toxin-antitoxin system